MAVIIVYILLPEIYGVCFTWKQLTLDSSVVCKDA